MPLPVTAAIVPETCVPWPWSSWAIADDRCAFFGVFWNGQRYAVFRIMFEPDLAIRFARRSGWLKSAPVST